VKHAIDQFELKEMSEHIQTETQTIQFMNAFDDERFGQCEETFTAGPAYWLQIPEKRNQYEGFDLK